MVAGTVGMSGRVRSTGRSLSSQLARERRARIATATRTAFARSVSAKAGRSRSVGIEAEVRTF
jgi:hypothetical protein